MWFRKRKASPAEMSRDLREQAFVGAVAGNVADAEDVRQKITALLMETGYPQAAASLVCFADGTTSLYVSTGGGILGAGQHDSVRAAAARLLGAGARDASLLVAVNEHRFHGMARSASMRASARPCSAVTRLKGS